jgi:hypothetical protein
MAQLEVRLRVVVPWWLTWVYLPMMQATAWLGIPVNPDACAAFARRHLKLTLV